MKVTQNDVAERAGVTRATVSYVLSGKAPEHSITDAVMRRVREASEELGYVGHHAARALVSGRSRTIGVLVGGPDGAIAPFWSLIAEGVERAAMQAGYDVLILSGRRDRESAGLSYLRQGKADGLIALGAQSTDLAAWRDAETPPVVLAPGGVSGFPTVRLDVSSGYGEACAHLTGLGHRRVLWVGPPEGSDVGRGAAATRAAGKCGLEPVVLRVDETEPPFWVPRDRCIEFWQGALREALPESLEATAVLCWNDRAALGLLALLGERGLNVPEDVSVVGFDDDEAAVALPPLSTIGQEYHEVGAMATRLALRVIEGRLSTTEARETVVQVPSHFVARRSTGPAPPA